ncbi:hypothetical protein HBI56_129860 [Parastagonospora nodorum]|uniref:Uncharacterized protein n=1 Tax=Phaeosphaeria nodorum (strain SN15 / ATCC MYA-4574 / FGSC 10173) TaxID=321614 RepID=A0A7U2HXX0_PHANO|nr:hypothetical protein HBH56_153950 [Parastagonospora nodorum]QRC95970.1 hypothetical protein JI435_408120 [Parastagonospora nodorum SN15]KAH3926616.1 hypothetical protein HBH54_163730 [Parastagonospora nodorum]KAH3943204.1 hypothetical protein HBH53_175470 [Parastagonospora nodorum]KAH3970398.1 hypothetical protein HBH52_167160 [Parastagonospora nodorum]
MLMVMAMASFQRLFMSTHVASPGPTCMAQPEPEGEHLLDFLDCALDWSRFVRVSFLCV